MPGPAGLRIMRQAVSAPPRAPRSAVWVAPAAGSTCSKFRELLPGQRCALAITAQLFPKRHFHSAAPHEAP